MRKALTRMLSKRFDEKAVELVAQAQLAVQPALDQAVDLFAERLSDEALFGKLELVLPGPEASNE